MELPPQGGLEPELAAALVRSSSDGILAFDRELRYTYWNPGMERLSGMPAAEVLGRVAFEIFPFLIEMGEDHAFREALAGRHTVTRDRPFRVPATGRRGFFEGSYSPLRDAAGEIIGGVAIIRDVTGRRAMEESGQRFAFLAEVGRELSSSLDAGRMLERMAELLVERMADYVIIDLFQEGGEIRRAAVAHRKLEGREILLELRRRFPPTLGASTGAALVLRTGESLLWEEVSEERLRQAVRDEDHLRLMTRLGVSSVIVVPFMSQGRVLGALSLVIAGGERRFGPADLALAEEIAHRAALALDNARRVEDLAAADRRKDEFLAMLAHELRNPLAAIANAGTVLDRRGMAGGDPRSGELLAMIGRQIRHLSRLVDDLLDVSRFSRGRIELRQEIFELRRAVEGAVETARPLIELRRHELTVALPDEPLWLEADVTRIEQVLANLLHNAAKFTEPGGRIALAATREGEEAVIRVRDTGAGISPELLPRIFDLFVQEERSLARSQGGLGIGLTLVRDLIDRHGGHIAVASDGPGRGSEFTVRLPLAAGPEILAAAAPAAEADRSSRVLLVEDNLDAAEALAELLRLWGHDVEMAHDGHAALSLARREAPEVVLLDIGLPGMDGYEVARELRRLPGLAETRIVALTGYGQEADRRRSSQAGFDDHLVKPVDLDILRGLLADSGISGRNLA